MRVFKSQMSASEQAFYAALLCVCAVATGLAASEGYSPPAFGHYQPILDRMPFGALPADFNAVPVDPATIKNEEQVKADQQKLAKQINMSAVNVTPDGETAIGFTDLSEKTPINYYLMVGSTAGGWSVLSADYDEETATIEKDGVSITLKLGKGLVDPAAQPTKPGSPAAAGSPLLGLHRGLAPKGMPGERPAAPPFPAALALPNRLPDRPPESAHDVSYRERLLERKQQEDKVLQAAAKKQQEQFKKMVQEVAVSEIKKREEEAAQAAANAPQPNEPLQEAPLQEVQQAEAPNALPPDRK